jgi:tryptophanyl-tRNA synthetase
MIVKEGARVMSLVDGTNKMSKSAENDNSRINLLDSMDVVAKKIKRCKTDAEVGLEWDNPARPECTNLLNIYRSVTGKTRDEIADEVKDMTWGTFKPVLADAVVEHLRPIQEKYFEVMEDELYLDQVLKEGREAAEVQAEQTLLWAKEAMGFDIPKK